MLEIKNLSIAFDKQILSDVSLACKKGEIVSVTGPSGSGKTSLIRFIMGELNEQQGAVIYNNKIISNENRDVFLFNVICYIDQFSSYFSNMSIYNHFKFYAKLYKIKVKKKDIKAYLSKVKLEKISLWKSPSKLSTGERKRFLIALALMLKKEIIIMDEPTASLDQNNISIILDIIKELSDTGITFLISTHNKDVMDISDTIYEIKDTKLIKTVYKNKENIVSIKEYKKPRYINYSKYKNLRLRVLFIFIVLLGGITTSYVSHILSQTIVYKEALNEDVPSYKNDKVYVGKQVDIKHSLDNYYMPWRQPWLGHWDIISEDDLNKILEIEGVKKVRRQLIVEGVSSYASPSGEPKVDTRPLYIYKDGELIKTDNIKYEKDGKFSNKSIYAVGYYPDEIKINGEYLNGIYINDILYEMIEMEDIEGIEIEYDAALFYKYRYVTYTFSNNDGNESHTRYELNASGSTNKIRIPIDGMITRNEYHDSRFFYEGPVIYVPIDKLKEIIRNNEGLKMQNIVITDDMFDFMTRTCVVVCDEGKDEEVMLAINELEGGYFAEAPYYSNKEMISMLDMQNTSSLSLAIIFSLLLIGCESLLISYYVRLRKTEMILLNRNGLSKKISGFLSQDDYKMGVFWVALSVMCWYIAFLITPIKEYASVELHQIVWLSITVIFTGIIILIKRRFVYQLRKKMIS